MLNLKLINEALRSSIIALQANNHSVLVTAWELAAARVTPLAFASVISCITSALCGGPRPPVRQLWNNKSQEGGNAAPVWEGNKGWRGFYQVGGRVALTHVHAHAFTQ